MESVFVWWIGEAEQDGEPMQRVRHDLARALNCPVFLWESPERPRHAYDPKRKQWHTAPILRWLVELGPDFGKVLGVTDQDLFIPILTYVFGEAQLSGRAAVVSLARLAESVGPVDRAVFFSRAAKEAIHEIGHAFGLLHCQSEGCVMGRSPAVREVDGKTQDFCEDCRAVLEAPPDGRSGT